MTQLKLFAMVALISSITARAEVHPLDVGYALLKKVAANTPATKVYLGYHKAHLKAFKAVLNQVEDAKKMGRTLNALESNFKYFNASAIKLINASRALPSDPLKIMGDRLVGTREDLAYVKKYNATAHQLRRSLNEALKTARSMQSNYSKLVNAIKARGGFTRKMLIEEWTLFEKRMSRRYGRRFSVKIAEVSSSLKANLAFTWRKIEYSADILR